MKKYILKKSRFICYLMAGFVTVVYAQQNVPSNLITLDSDLGQKLFYESNHKQSYWRLSEFFVSQEGLSWCAIASDVMALNALNVTPPLTVKYYPYSMFTQDDFFGADQLRVTTPAKVYHSGVTLDENAKLLASYGLKVSTRHADKRTSIEKFREEAISAVSSTDRIVLINFCREVIGEVGCGHFSPLAAYDQSVDKFLLLDVARYKYPPVWISTKELYQSMSQGLDSLSNMHRGYIVISKE
ncbi:MAG: phytochelatin synthase [Gammaproteobacteria bacterium]|jgi:hypothetical protein|nr:phytochelatin synthase [Gammaproteobacteria bacterium]